MFLLMIVLSFLPDPSASILAVGNTPHGILLTDGRGQGLYLLQDGDVPQVISPFPGAGRNVVILETGVLFKECPDCQDQRVVFRSWSGEGRILHEANYFSGPFPWDDVSFAVLEPGLALRLSMAGNVLESWELEGYPCSAALSGSTLFYTGENGGLYVLDTVSGESFHLEDAAGTTFSELSANAGGLVLAEMAPGGFLVLDGTGRILLCEENGLFPRWASDGRVIYSRLEYRGMEPVSGDVVSLDPVLGERTLPVSGVTALNPSQLSDNTITWTETDGGLHGIEASIPREDHPLQELLDPDGHIDVVYMHQRWDTPDWFNGSWSCGPTSCMMATQYYRMLTPDTIWASFPSPGHWSLWGNYIPVEYTFLGYTYDDLGESPGGVFVPGAHGFICPDGGAWWNLMVDFLNQHQIYSAWAGTVWSTLVGEIDDSYPVVCSSSVLGYGHIILLCGYYADHTIVVNDPYGDANESGWGNYYNGKDVLYDWPGYNNGHLEIGVSQLFYARAQVPADPDSLVDDCSRGFYKYGNCRYWHLTGSGYQGNSWWTYSTGAPPDTCIAYWFPELPAPGSYEVSVYVPPDRATATGIYRLSTPGGMVEVYLDQGLYSDQWVSLGTYSLDTDAYLRLGDYTGTGGEYIAFDAVKFSSSGTGIESGPAQEADRIIPWPNPAGETLYLSLPAERGPYSVQLFDASGRLVFRGDAEGSQVPFTFDTSGLCSGIYVLRIDGSEGPVCSRLVTICSETGGP